MDFQELSIQGAYLISPPRHGDARGFLMRAFCREAFRKGGVAFEPVQANFSYSRSAGTLRGLHYQAPPHAEAKLVCCCAGAVFDVLVDLRPQSPTFGRWAGVQLSADAPQLLYVPERCAHGFETLRDESAVHYMTSHPYSPASERGVRWDDPALAITWPLPPAVLSPKDRSHDDLCLDRSCF